MQLVHYPSKRSPISFRGSTESAIQQTGGGVRDARSYRKRPHTLPSPMKASVYGPFTFTVFDPSVYFELARVWAPQKENKRDLSETDEGGDSQVRKMV